MLLLITIIVNTIIVSLQPADCCVKAKTINTNRQLILCSKKVTYCINCVLPSTCELNMDNVLCTFTWRTQLIKTFPQNYNI